MNMVDELYRLASFFPPHEHFALRSQMIRAAISVPSNIAEGAARNSTKEFLRFIAIARGSLAELETQRLISIRQSYFSEEDAHHLYEMLEEIGRMLAGLQKSLQQKLSQ